MDNFNIFLFFPFENIESVVNTEFDLQNYLEEIKILIYRTQCENNTKLFYDSSNISQFIENIETLIELGNFEKQYINILLYEKLLKNADNWQEKPFFDNSTQTKYCLWNFHTKNKQTNEIAENFPNVLKEITERNLQNKEEKFLFLNINKDFDYKRKFIPILKDNLKNTSQNLPQFIHIQYVSNFQELEKWFKANRKTKNYNFNDNRHLQKESAKNTKAKKANKSPIIDNGKQHLATFLEDAIGYPLKVNYLINFDDKNSQYIRFEYENDNPQNQYHGYHLVLQETNERDEAQIKKIPQEIKDILDYREKIIKLKK